MVDQTNGYRTASTIPQGPDFERPPRRDRYVGKWNQFRPAVTVGVDHGAGLIALGQEDSDEDRRAGVPDGKHANADREQQAGEGSGETGAAPEPEIVPNA